jgi:uncharacterized surface protein with fasciclin (FAS1) repeats
MKTVLTIAATAATLILAAPGSAAPQNGNIIATVVTSPVHNTLEAAIKAAKLTSTLANSGPYTLFAPTDDAFAKLPAGTVETLLKPENRDQLRSILSYHVVPGRYTAAYIVQQINANGGSYELTTLQGGTLTARLVDGKVVITDASSGTATVITADLNRMNGVVHVTDAVFLPSA